jgi:hypothetical protein
MASDQGSPAGAARGRRARSVRSILSWAGLGLVAAGLGWVLGGLIGGFLPRFTLATAVTAGAFGLLSRKPPLALIAAGLVGAVAAGVYLLGMRFGSPFLVWPAAALVLGALATRVLTRTRARIAALLAIPIFATLGLVAGMVGVTLTGLTLNEARLVAQNVAGGAVGFGLMALASFKAIDRWLDRPLDPGRSTP